MKQQIIKIEDIRSDRWRALSGETVKDLMGSIKKFGLQSFPLVRREKSKYMIIDGLGRIEAMKRLGYKEVKCWVKSMTEEETLQFRILESVKRNPLSLQELGRLVNKLRLNGWTWKQISEKTGHSFKTLKRFLASYEGEVE
jgi:ParB family chromosome partitioning protein